MAAVVKMRSPSAGVIVAAQDAALDAAALERDQPGRRTRHRPRACGWRLGLLLKVRDGLHLSLLPGITVPVLKDRGGV